MKDPMDPRLSNPEGKQSLPGNLTDSQQIPPRPVAALQANESTLYIGNLNPNVTEQRLITFFKDKGTIESFRIMRDVYSGESRRFGFVTFKDPQEAEKAKNALNYEKLDGYEIRICFKRNPSDFKNFANIFIKNIPPTMSTREVEKMCVKFGKVLSCIVRTDESGKSLGYGCVQFEDEATANQAIQNLNDLDLNGHKLSVKKFVPQKNRPVNKSNIYLKNFPAEWKTKEIVEEHLTAHLKKFGEITSFGVFPHNNPETNEPSFFAFVAFKNQEDAEKAIEHTNKKDIIKVIKGEPADVQDEKDGVYACIAQNKWQRRRALKQQSATQKNLTNIFIKSLKPEVTEEMLKNVLLKYGPLVSVCIKESKMAAAGNNGFLKFAFANFKNAADAEKLCYEGKKNQELAALVTYLPNAKNKEFICYHQPKATRDMYQRLKMRMYNAANYMNYNFPRMPHFPAFPVSRPFVAPPQMNSTPGTTSRQSEKETNPYTTDWLKKNRREFEELNPEKRKNILGNLMFHRVSECKKASKEQVPKITGMLIDLEILDYAEIIDILENDQALNERVTEALEIIEDPASQ